MLIKNARIFDAVSPAPYSGDIRIQNGKISAIEAVLAPEEGEEILDVCGKNVYPGFVEAHCHLGIHNMGISGKAMMDFNESKNNPVTPQLRGLDAFNPQDMCVPEALAAGVTTACTGPGSANVVGGTFLAVKTVGNCVDDMIVKEPIAMKVAFGENPKNVYNGKGCGTRMAIAQKLREILEESRDYMLRKEAAGEEYNKRPKYDMRYEAMIPVLKGEIPLKAHAHRADDILTAIRIAKEYGVKLTLEHTTEGHLIVEELVRAGYPVAVGPSYPKYTKFETRNVGFSTAGILADAGLNVSIITDHPVQPLSQLPLCAALAVREGMKPFDALKAITINAARHNGIQDRVGSLEAGKDADLVIAAGELLRADFKPDMVIVDGRIAYQRA